MGAYFCLGGIFMGELILETYDSDEYFIVTTDNILEPLGVQVIGDTRYDLLPPTVDTVESIPGMHGEIDFDTTFGMRVLEMHVALDEGMTTAQKLQARRDMAKYLNPLVGYKKLIFMDDPTVAYEVKYAGKIGFEYNVSWFEFVIPFKVKPFIISASEHSLTGTGSIVNAGTFECPIFIDIPGPATNPYISVGASLISYGSAVASGEILIIDTQKQTAYISAITPINAMAYISGDIDYALPPSISVSVIPSISTAIVRWNDLWL